MSYGQELLRRYLAVIVPMRPLENHRPAWLGGLELDFFYPDIGLAFEFQGDQHYIPVFGSQADLFRRRRRDVDKRRICIERGIVLVRIDAIHLSYDAIIRRTKFARRDVHGKRGQPLPGLNKGSDAKRRCRPIAKLAIAYRELLRAKYNSPSAMQRKCAPRKAAMKQGFA